MNGEQLPKAGNHSPVKSLDLSSDFLGSHRGTTTRLTGTHSPRLPPGPNPSRDPRPSSPELSRLNFHPAASSPEGHPPPGSPELTRPGSRPARIPPETRGPTPPEPSRLISTRHQLPQGNHRPAHRNALTPAPAQPESLLRPAAQLHRNRPGSFSTRRQPEGPARIALCLSPKGRPIRSNGTRVGRREARRPGKLCPSKVTKR